jgi:hypothetical protein
VEPPAEKFTSGSEGRYVQFTVPPQYSVHDPSTRNTKHRTEVVVLASTAAVAGLVLFATFSLNNSDAKIYTLPTSIHGEKPGHCAGTDVSGALSSWLNSLPADSTVSLPADKCFDVQAGLWIKNTTGLTIEGNGATFYKPILDATSDLADEVRITSNTDLSISDVNITGPYAGTDGGVSYETEGLSLICNAGVNLSDLKVSDQQGDFFNLDANLGDKADDGCSSLNTNVKILDSTFTNAGYHGFVVEGGRYDLIEDDTFNNMPVDAMDFEYDVYSSGIKSNGNATFAGEDDITVQDCTFNNWGDDWFASIQPQTPGVQENNIVLTKNTLNSPKGALVQVEGPPAADTTAPYVNKWLTITNNHSVGISGPISGGSIATPNPPVGPAISIENKSDVTISKNVFPLYEGSPTYYYDTPYIAGAAFTNVTTGTIKNNTFHGAYDVLDPYSSGNTNITECGNYYWKRANRVDANC